MIYETKETEKYKTDEFIKGDINNLRAKIVNKNFNSGDDNPIANCKGMDLSHLPPCRSSLRKHIQRANYQAMIWKQSDCNYQELTIKEYHGWNKNGDGNLVVDWNDADVFPKNIVDILTQKEK